MSQVVSRLLHSAKTHETHMYTHTIGPTVGANSSYLTRTGRVEIPGDWQTKTGHSWGHLFKGIDQHHIAAD